MAQKVAGREPFARERGKLRVLTPGNSARLESFSVDFHRQLFNLLTSYLGSMRILREFASEIA
jgi:hypothetical protein